MREDVCIVIVNWNGWRHTIECLESLLRIETNLLHVIVADCASTDNSVEHIRDWAAEKIVAPMDGPPWHLLPRRRVLRPVLTDHAASRAMHLDILALARNGGFAAGCNAGIRYGVEKLNCRYVWLLNNDTVADPEALLAFIQCFAENPRLGLCGGVLCEYNRPGTIQALGGGFDVATTVSWHIGGGQPLSALPFPAKLREKFFYPIGASMVVSRDFIREVGLMNEEYFLYYEELDWVERGRSKYEIGICDKAIVYHKEGAAIGTAAARKKSTLSTYYLVHSKLRFLERYYPHCLGKAYKRLFKEIRKHLQHGEFRSTWTMVRAIWDFRRRRATASSLL